MLPAGKYSIGMPYLGYPGHYGADYPAAIGTPVFAPWPGTVEASYDLPGSNSYNNTPYRSYGRVVKLKFANGLEMLSAHLSQRNVSAGQHVLAGQQIGAVGMNGNATGPHLHAEFSRNGSTFNPASLGIFDKGGWLMPGMGGVNLSSKPEPVFNDSQWGTLQRLTTTSAAHLSTARNAQAADGRLADEIRRVAERVDAVGALLGQKVGDLPRQHAEKQKMGRF